MTTYYVATNGSDSGKGTSSSPWRTISKAMQANLKPGDEVVVRSGTYKEGVDVNKDGRPATSRCAPRCPAAPRSTRPAASTASTSTRTTSRSMASKSTGAPIPASPATASITSRSPTTSSTTTIGNGIVMSKSDFMTVEGNVVYGNAARGAASGIHRPGREEHHREHLDERLSRHRPRQRLVQERGRRRRIPTATESSSTTSATTRSRRFRPTSSRRWSRTTLSIRQRRASSVSCTDNVTVRSNISYHNNTDLRRHRYVAGRARPIGVDNNTWIENIAVTIDVQGNTAIGNVSFSGKTRDASWSGQHHLQRHGRRDSITTNNGNSLPSASNNDLGTDPGLSLSEIKAMGAALTGNAAASKAAADTATAEAAADLVLDGGAGTDKLTGGAGDDTRYGRRSTSPASRRRQAHRQGRRRQALRRSRRRPPERREGERPAAGRARQGRPGRRRRRRRLRLQVRRRGGQGRRSAT